MPSFDVVSEVDVQEVRNAIDQAHRELSTRFDFKGTDSTIEFKDNSIELESASEERLKAAAQVLEEKLVRRKVSLKALDYGKVEEASRDARAEGRDPGRHQRRQGTRDRQVHQGLGPEGRAAPGASRSAARDRQEARRPSVRDRSHCASTTSAYRSTSRTSATEPHARDDRSRNVADQNLCDFESVERATQARYGRDRRAREWDRGRGQIDFPTGRTAVRTDAPAPAVEW